MTHSDSLAPRRDAWSLAAAVDGRDPRRYHPWEEKPAGYPTRLPDLRPWRVDPIPPRSWALEQLVAFGPGLTGKAAEMIDSANLERPRWWRFGVSDRLREMLALELRVGSESFNARSVYAFDDTFVVWRVLYYRAKLRLDRRCRGRVRGFVSGWLPAARDLNQGRSLQPSQVSKLAGELNPTISPTERVAIMRSINSVLQKENRNAKFDGRSSWSGYRKFRARAESSA